MNFSKMLAARSALNDPSVDDISENIQLKPIAWPGHVHGSMAACSSCSFTCTLGHIKLASTICKEILSFALFLHECVEENKY